MSEQPVEQLSIKKFPIEEMQLNSKVCIIGKPGCYIEGTPTLLYNGKIKNVEDIIEGDIVMGDDSTPRTVMSLCRGVDKMYKIKPNKGDEIVVNSKHKLVLKCTGYNAHPKGEVIEITVENFLQKSKTFQQRYKWFKAPAKFQKQKVSFDPYVIGYWLGDGTSATSEFTIGDEDYHIKSWMETYFGKFGLEMGPQSKLNPDNVTYRVKKGRTRQNIFLKHLKNIGIIGNKHIPLLYKCNSRENQLKLLAGIIDSDGSYDEKCHVFDIVQKREQLLNDIVFVARSLGLSAFKKKITKRCTNSPDKNHCGTYYRCHIYGKGIHEIPTKIPRKQIKERPRQKDNLVSGFSVEYSHEGQYYGFTLNGNHRFLLGDFSVVRNTGKSTLLTDLLYQHRKRFPLGLIMSGTEASTSYFGGMVPDLFIYGGYNHDAMTRLLIRQKRMVRKNG